MPDHFGFQFFIAEDVGWNLESAGEVVPAVATADGLVFVSAPCSDNSGRCWTARLL
jgi:hypothetical protein